jgi:hypothetical protein
MRTLALAALVLAATPAFAEGSSHVINTAPVRGFVKNHLVAGNTLKPGQALDPAHRPAGVTAAAASKAAQTLRGMTGFNSGIKAANYVTTMGKEKLVITASAPGQKVGTVGGGSMDAEQEFVIRTGKTGVVIGRGNLDGATGKLDFTRSHNTESESEVNAAAK